MPFAPPKLSTKFANGVNPVGAATMYVGEYADNKMVIDSVITNKDGKKTINRMTFFHLDANTVRQLGEASNDDGKTWTPTFDFKYVRKK